MEDRHSGRANAPKSQHLCEGLRGRPLEAPDPNPSQRHRSPAPPALGSPPPLPPEWRLQFLHQASYPEAGPRPTLQRQSSTPEVEAGWHELPPSAWPPGITEMADAQPGPSGRASRIVWQEGHHYRVKTSMRGTRVFRKE
ncbi:GH14402 [Drosophila grimshawi]|uniref:GH14402 n=1 Tax=Drosophila grimshawi TaxID=7222 RepID=B4J1A6_DROGR|nr:GH14402 [Drosophila grimshawi]